MALPMSDLPDDEFSTPYSTFERDSADAPESTRRRTFSLDGLNPVQREAAEHVDGPLLVVAGAGSGKTRVLTHRIAHLITNHGVHPMNILAITFTNKAAGEMKHRVQQLIGPVAKSMWVSTFHSACVRILRMHAERIGYPKNFSIYDQADAQRLTGYVIRDMGFDQKFVDVHAIFYKDYPNVEKVEANSHHFDFGTLNEQFDLIFVDGDHSYEGVENDTRKVFPLRKDSKSVIVWHDYGYNSEDVRADAWASWNSCTSAAARPPI